MLQCIIIIYPISALVAHRALEFLCHWLAPVCSPLEVLILTLLSQILALLLFSHSTSTLPRSCSWTFNSAPSFWKAGQCFSKIVSELHHFHAGNCASKSIMCSTQGLYKVQISGHMKNFINKLFKPWQIMENGGKV